MTTTETTMTTEAVLTKLQAEVGEVTAQRAEAQREVEASTARMQRLERRISSLRSSRLATPPRSCRGLARSRRSNAEFT